MNILEFIITILPIVLSPGVSFTLAMTNVVSQGIKGLIVVVLGTALGIYTHAFLAGLGTSSIVAKYPHIMSIINIIGTVYLMYIAILLIKNGISNTANYRYGMAKKITIKEAYIANLFNIKAIMFYLTVIPRFSDVAMPYIDHFMILASIHILIMVLWLAIMAYLVSLASSKINLLILSKTINIIGGCCLFYFSLHNYSN
ncbi:Lysine exporter protein (LYSE/YGGA) [Xenorhabdus poinarii G6]|uniref:Lysine exporter protein (LYSE/YGGA) n=1 Tax=Xenorhabdus poinarii G6 TaxID=1354304 RepID=A0A068R5S8_9GAMM|nr:Lysine exporter protein (LYSE/YGGA) [Xenorhabdus poinarii G6]